MSQWVQHISGQGKRWKNVESFRCTSQWMVEGEMVGGHHFLPKSEYILCDPPEAWEDVTERVTVANGGSDLVLDGRQWRAVYQSSCQRLRKVPICTNSGLGIHEPTKQWAFIVEKKKS